MPCYNPAITYHVQWHGSHRSFLWTLYIMPSTVGTGVWSSIFTWCHGGHCSLLQTLLPHVIVVTGVSCTSCTYVMAVTSVWRISVNLSTATSVTKYSVGICSCACICLLFSCSLYRCMSSITCNCNTGHHLVWFITVQQWHISHRKVCTKNVKKSVAVDTWQNTATSFFLNFSFMWPRCIVTNFCIIKPTRCTNFPYLLQHETLHVSGSSSAHHQEFIHCTLGTGQRNCPKHVEFHAVVSLGNWCIWLVLL
jgi:hypothetical protein